jgi:hypothetical protein
MRVNFDIDKRIPNQFKNTDTANFKITVKGMLSLQVRNAVYLREVKQQTYTILIIKIVF